MKSITNKLRLRFTGSVVGGTNGMYAVAAIFRDAITNAVAADAIGITTANFLQKIVVEGEIVPGTVSPITLSVRAGVTASAIRFSSANGARILGGAMVARLTMDEIVA